MYRILVLLMIGVPALEIWGLVKAAQIIGITQTVLLVILTGFIGAYLLKREGLKTWLKFQEDLRYGEIPGNAIMDGICIFAGGLLLLTPGFFTDTIGFILLLPFTRPIIQTYLIKWLKKKMKDGSFHYYIKR